MKTVLLLDDDEDFRSRVAASLRAAKLEVVEAGTVAAAEKTLARIAVDLVVVDGALPDGHGADFIETLRASNRTVRIIFVSTAIRDLQTVERLTKELDVSSVIYEPVDAEDLTNQIRQLLDKPKTPVIDAGPANLAAELNALREQFAENLPGKLQELAAAVAHAQIDHKSIIDARGLAHRLRGSAGSYGHPALGEAVGHVRIC